MYKQKQFSWPLFKYNNNNNTNNEMTMIANLHRQTKTTTVHSMTIRRIEGEKTKKTFSCLFKINRLKFDLDFPSTI